MHMNKKKCHAVQFQFLFQFSFSFSAHTSKNSMIQTIITLQLSWGAISGTLLSFGTRKNQVLWSRSWWLKYMSWSLLDSFWTGSWYLKLRVFNPCIIRPYKVLQAVLTFSQSRNSKEVNSVKLVLWATLIFRPTSCWCRWNSQHLQIIKCKYKSNLT